MSNKRISDLPQVALTSGMLIAGIDRTRQSGDQNVAIEGSSLAPAALATLTDCIISTPTLNQVLAWNGVKWANAVPQGGALAELSDVALTSPAANQILAYNGSQWVNDTGTTIPAYLAANPGTPVVSDLLLVAHSSAVIGVTITALFTAWLASLATSHPGTSGVPWLNAGVLEVS